MHKARLKYLLAGAVVLALAAYLAWLFFPLGTGFFLRADERRALDNRGALVVGVADYDPPFSLSNVENVRPGIFVEAMRELGRLLDVDVRFRTLSPGRIEEALEKGSVDAVIGPCPASLKGRLIIATQNSLCRVPLVVFIRTSEKEVSTLEDLRGKTIGVLKGGPCERLLRRRSGYLLRAASNCDELLDLVFTGEAAAVAGRYQTIRYFLRKKGKETRLRALPPLQSHDYRILLRDTDGMLRHVLDKALEHLEVRGILQEIESVFAGVDGTYSPPSAYERAFYASAAALLLLLLVFLVLPGRLESEKRKVKQDLREAGLTAAEGAPLTRLSVREVLDSLLRRLRLSCIAFRTKDASQSYFIPESLPERTPILEDILLFADEPYLVPYPGQPSWYVAKLPRGGRIAVRVRSGQLNQEDMEKAYLYAAMAEATALAVESASSFRSMKEILKTALECKGEAFLIMKQDFTVEEIYGGIAGISRTELEGASFLKLLDRTSFTELHKNLEEVKKRQEFVIRGNLVLHSGERAVPCSYTLIFKILSYGERLLLHLSDESVRARALDVMKDAYRAESLAVQAISFVATFERFFLSIQGYANLLSERSSETDQPRVRRILEFSRRGTRLANLLLSLVDPNRGMKFQTVELGTFVDDYIRPLEAVFPEHKITVIPPGRNYYFDGVPELVFLAAFALAANAVEASPKGSEVRISFYDEQVKNVKTLTTGPILDKFYVVMSVEDQGTGMKAAERKRIFEPFFTTKGKGHRGLGLSAALFVAKNMGGGIDVESEAGTGTKVLFFIPAREQAVTMEAGLQGEGQNILIINPSQEWLDILVSLFNRFGYTPSGVSNRKDALRLLHLQFFHCVLINAEERRGETTAIIDEIKRTRPTMPVIVLAEPGELPYYSRVLRDGTIKVLPRSGDVKEIIREVRAVISGHHGT